MLIYLILALTIIKMNLLNDLQIPGAIIQIGEVNRLCQPDDKLNMFFCANVSDHDPMRSRDNKGGTKHPMTHRASDIDIVHKNYIYFDFDIRKDMEEMGLKIKDSEIKRVAESMADELESRRYFQDWSYIVFTGNGLHIYYIDAEPTLINHDHFSIGYDLMRRKMHTLVGYEPDPACKNPARIARLPGSYNNKGSIPKLVEVVKYQDKRSKILPIIMKRGAEEEKRLRGIAEFEESLREIRKRECLYSTDEIIEKINQIPIQNEILKDYPSWRFDGKNFWNPDKSRACSSFINDKKVLIISDSRWFASIQYKGCGTFLYRREMSELTNKQTIDYFKSYYNII